MVVSAMLAPASDRGFLVAGLWESGAKPGIAHLLPFSLDFDPDVMFFDAQLCRYERILDGRTRRHPDIAKVAAEMRWQVGCNLAFTIIEPTEVVIQVLAARSDVEIVAEHFRVDIDGEIPHTVSEIPGPHGTRLKVVKAERGCLAVDYQAEIYAVESQLSGSINDASSDGRSISRSHDLAYDVQQFLRPSRYCPSDRLIGFVVAEFGVDHDTRSRTAAITEWIRRRIDYVSGSSTVHDSAEDTLLSSAGTCRDFAHLGIALNRASGIPARFVAGYAPGLSPMDFHAVFETFEDGQWCVHDATGLAPRQSLVRIATGRDAADAAFISFTNGMAACDRVEVFAIVEPALPVDDQVAIVTLT